MRPRTRILLSLMPMLLVLGCTQELEPPTEEAPSVTWYDDYFTVEYIDAETIAIGEPRYHQQNYSYLILGEKRAILFDSGPGIRNIKPVVESLTDLPITVTQSHLHYDHVGNHAQFEGAALPDLPHLRRRQESGKLPVRFAEHLGFVENIEAPILEVSEWWPNDSTVDLGGRTLTVIHAPGHTKDSIVLFDQDRKLLFTGDYVVPGPNYLGFLLPGSSLEDYLASARRLLDIAPSDARLLTAHRDKSSVSYGAPVLAYADLIDFEKSMKAIHDGRLDGKGFFAKTYRINGRVEFIVNR